MASLRHRAVKTEGTEEDARDEPKPRLAKGAASASNFTRVLSWVIAIGVTVGFSAFIFLHSTHTGINGQLSEVLHGSRISIYKPETLAQFNGADGGPLYMAILGDVFDVSSKPEFYAPSNGYNHFVGRDGSRGFITGDFVGDLNDDVSDFDEEQCLGLVEWRKFYFDTYKHMGRVTGAFYDALGVAKDMLHWVEQRAVAGERVREERAKQADSHPACNTKWTQHEGGFVWCDNDWYPRKHFVGMEGGSSQWRCACFEQLGWSDLRQVYQDCAPDAHQCRTSLPGT